MGPTRKSNAARRESPPALAGVHVSEPGGDDIIDPLIRALARTPRVVPDELIGRIIDRRYRIDRRVGQGGFGTVYAAFHLSLGVPVALKVLRLAPGASSDMRAQRVAKFMDEARTLPRLRHPHIVAALDLGILQLCDEDTPYLVMEWCGGSTLTDVVAAGPMPLAAAWSLFEPIVDAIAFAHKLGVVHRDLKPNNVTVSTVDDTLLPRVIDFGIAKAVDCDDVRLERTTSEVVFTPAYAAPEQVAGRGTGPWTDVHALGLLFVELLAGRPPFDSKSEGLGSIDPARPTPRALGIEVGAFEPVLAQAIALAPSERHRNAGQLLVELREAARATGLPTAGAPRLAGAPRAQPDSADRHRSVRPVANAVAQDSTKKSIAQSIRPDGALSRRAPTAPWWRAPLTLVVGAAVASAAAFVGPEALERGANRAQQEAAVSPPAKKPPLGLEASSKVPGAAAAYRSALNAMCEGRRAAGIAELERAASLDPEFAAAHLRFGAYTFSSHGSQSRAREAIAKAAELASSLSELDQLFLDAVTPAILRQPSDWGGSERKTQVMLERYPDFAEGHLWAGIVHIDLGRPNEAIAAAERARSLRPECAVSILPTLVYWSLYADRPLEARQYSEECRRASTTASPMCVTGAAYLRELDGDCSSLEDAARTLTVASPSDATGYQVAAAAAAALDEPREAVLELLTQRWTRLADTQRPREEAHDRARLAALHGDFAESALAARRMQAALAGDSSREAHGRWARLLVHAFLETGQKEQARQAADDFMQRRSAWVADAISTNFSYERDPTPLMISTLVEVGALARNDARSRRSSWLEEVGRSVPGLFHDYGWAHAFTEQASVAGDAEDAMSAFAGGKLPTFWPRALAEAGIGRVSFLAGRKEEAVRWLERAVRKCRALHHPFEYVQALYWLGRAREPSVDDACPAYASVLRHWGAAKPPSRTAAAARERMRALGCRPAR